MIASLSQTLILSLCSFACMAGVGLREAGAADSQSIVQALKAVAGNPPGVRAAFAKGQCVHGSYTPSPDATKVTNSESFIRPWPIVGRFSISGGNPKVADTSKVNLRGFSVKLLSGSSETHLLLENAPVHFAKTLDQMLAFLRVRAPGTDGKPNQEAIIEFTKANPETTRQAEYVKGKPLPGSYAGVVYWGVHSFTGINATGHKVPFKFKLVPHAGEIGLTDEEAKSKAPGFLFEELTQRLKKDPVRFDVVALLAEPGDDLSHDVTLRWKNEDKRLTITLGTVAITGLEPNETCDDTIFDPGLIADGIEPPADEIFEARKTAYAISLGLRSK
ncbi:catalase family peroxidase [Rhizobium sp. SSA_523]|uniref:catalase family peroxidase n=1 Tax=Rhizobium sp. SSA_523 TaxID=2952477 RepID=UPI002091BD22|nr:catalase family peroxidase [Rhizobium sp. SSA_523]MCO5734336.1 catalase family peroxidase [Rhizobium sp. SSA_523]